MRVLLDTNVILDALLRRPPWHVEASTVWEAIRQGRLACAATVVSIASHSMKAGITNHNWTIEELVDLLPEKSNPNHQRGRNSN